MLQHRKWKEWGNTEEMVLKNDINADFLEREQIYFTLEL